MWKVFIFVQIETSIENFSGGEIYSLLRITYIILRNYGSSHWHGLLFNWCRTEHFKEAKFNVTLGEAKSHSMALSQSFYLAAPVWLEWRTAKLFQNSFHFLMHVPHCSIALHCSYLPKNNNIYIHLLCIESQLHNTWFSSNYTES